MYLYRFVDKVGVELEGGWDVRPPDFQHDGSVNDIEAMYVGEVASPPLLPHDMPDWMRKHYPQIQNKTCGMHVHVSVQRTKHYAMLIERGFLDHVIAALKTWGKSNSIIKHHPFWDRINGYNSFCKNEFVPNDQMHYSGKGGARYTMLNYTWARYGTVECRVLPMFRNVKIAISGVTAVMNAFENWIKQYKEEDAEKASKVCTEDFDLTPERLHVENDTVDLSPTSLNLLDSVNMHSQRRT